MSENAVAGAKQQDDILSHEALIFTKLSSNLEIEGPAQLNSLIKLVSYIFLFCFLFECRA